MTCIPLALCILGKFLGVVCHCFPPPLDVPTFAARCLYVRNDARDPSSERWNCGREIYPVILPTFRLPRKFRDILHAANLRHGTDGFTSPPKQIEDKVVSSRGWEGEECIDLAQDVDKWWDLGNVAINCRVLLNLWDFLTSKESGIIPRRNLQHGFSQLTCSLVKVSKLVG